MSNVHNPGTRVVATSRRDGIATERPGVVTDVKHTAKGAFITVQLDGDKLQAFRPVNVRPA